LGPSQQKRNLSNDCFGLNDPRRKFRFFERDRFKRFKRSESDLQISSEVLLGHVTNDTVPPGLCKGGNLRLAAVGGDRV